MKYTHPALKDDMTGKPIHLNVFGHYEVCPSCQGHGTTFRSDLDESALVEMMEEDADYDGLSNYQKGDYDETCRECGGKRVVYRPNLPEWAQDKIRIYNENMAEMEYISRQERRMGA